MKALCIGRFQPFHKGHLCMVKHILQQCDQVILGIGSSQYSHTLQNPFSAEERHHMIHQALQEEGIAAYELVNIPDIHDPPQWVEHVLKLVPTFDVVFTNNACTCGLFSEKGIPVEATPVVHPKKYCGMVIRQHMVKGEPWEELVPEAVAKYIHKIDGVQRLQEIAKG
jgi:nicotinamide-nucleotide adenylyltransferase